MFKLLPLVICLLSSIASNAKASNEPSVDYLIFTQSWPAPKGLNWTVQGLWPKQYGDNLPVGPRNCDDRADTFNSTEVWVYFNIFVQVPVQYIE